MFLSNRKSAFTLIEIAITISIIVIISVVVYANYNEINDSGEVLAVSDKLREQVRLAQNFSLNGRLLSGKQTNGWGVHFNRYSGKYTVFGDLNGTQLYDYPTQLLIHGAETVSGSELTDSSMSGHKVYLHGSLTQDNGAGKPTGNGFWSFADAGDYLEATSSVNLNVATSSFAIDFWFKPNGDVHNATLFKYNDGGNDALVMKTAAASTTAELIFTDSDTTTHTIGNTTGTPLMAGSWYHLAAVRDRGFLKLFVNGQAQDVLSIGTSTALRYNSGATFKIGCLSGSTCSAGAIDELRIVTGWPAWTEAFTVPAELYGADEEKYREIKLPPGLVFDKFYRDTTPISDSIHLFFSPLDYKLRVNALSDDYSAIVTVNRGGVNSGSAGYAPRSFRVWPSGLISATTTPQ